MAILSGVWNWFGSWADHNEPDDTPRRKGLLRQLASIEQLANRIFLAIVVFIALYSFAQAKGSFLTLAGFSLLAGDFTKISGVLLGVMIAFAVLGGFLGFLFGIPRLLSHAGGPSGPSPGTNNANTTNPKPETLEKSASERAARRFFSSNTNLEEISDWITKIIVGLSLVQAGFIFEKIKKAAAVFKANSLPDVAGSDVVFVLVMVAAVIAGFLFFYMETRTRITLLFADLENAADESGPEVQQKVLDAVLGASIAAKRGASVAADGSVKAPDPIDEDKKILQADYADLKTPERLAAWASAQARQNNFQAAIRALNDAIAQKPDDKGLLVRLADVQQRRGNARDAYFSISEARQKSNDDADLLRRELLASLYLAPPDSFNKAFAIAEKLESIKAADDAWVQLWIACAYGQKYKWLLEKNGGDDDKATTKAAAMAALQRLVTLEKKKPDDGLRAFLRHLLDPASASADDDLQVFANDPDFKSLANA